MISVSGLSKSFGGQTLFEDVSFQLNPGERYGLVGANGSGKTTLLNILAGDEPPSDGSVSIPRRLDLGVLRQDQFLHGDRPILEVVMMGNEELWRAMVDKEKLLERADQEFDAERYSRLEDVVLRHDGYAAEARAGEVLEGLGLPTEIHRRPLSTLSGGFKLRVLLAQVLAGSPDTLLLDEPTNHLDILSIRWLEKFLCEFAGPVVVISHDHRFLDNVCTHILDVDYRTVTLYTGNYSRFLEAKRAERERREKEIAQREKEIAHHRQFVDRFRAKASKARQAQSKLRLIEKKAEELVELPPSSRRYPTFRFEQVRPSGREVLVLKGIEKSFAGGAGVSGGDGTFDSGSGGDRGDRGGRGDAGFAASPKKVLHGVDLTVRRGDRLAIMGPNGIGKSTLLKIAVGELEPDAGSVEWGYETYPGYFPQDHRARLRPDDRSVEAWLAERCPGETRGYVRNQLGRVLISGDEADKSLGALSGGEAARLMFCRLAIERPNVLVLDEPTNHLDMESIEALVEGLERYEGTLILVSHDRWFVSRLATRIVEIKPDEVLDYPGTYEEYVHHCGDDHLDVDTVVLKAKREKRAARADGGAETESDPGAGAPASAVADGESGSGDPGSGARVSGGGRDGDAGGRGAGNGTDGRHGHLSKNRARQLARRRDEILEEIERVESRVEEIHATFSDPGYYERTPFAEVRELEREQTRLTARIEELMAQWQEAETELGAAP